MLNGLKRIEQLVQFSFDGTVLQADQGDILAIASLAAGIDHVRQSVSPSVRRQRKSGRHTA